MGYIVVLLLLLKKFIIQTIVFLNTILFYSVFILYASVHAELFFKNKFGDIFSELQCLYYFRT